MTRKRKPKVPYSAVLTRATRLHIMSVMCYVRKNMGTLHNDPEYRRTLLDPTLSAVLKTPAGMDFCRNVAAMLDGRTVTP